ncbi:Branched-chain amino acid aminotransferase [Fusarium acuminatum]|uniref:Branched-chain amino acid aminotransferase n=1 Tax=Fusarium acuminatum TaxID=5515 RepID=A0ABZ2WLA3_9HYPO
MTARVAPGSSSYSESSTIISPTADHDVLRGRKRERSLTRGSVRSFRAALPDESSNLRGRSRRRAASPALSYTSRPSSPRRSRGPRPEMELGAQQSTDGLSGLRNEVRASSSDTADETKSNA